MFLASQFLALFFLSVTLADPPPYTNSSDFDLGRLGIFPELAFNSTALKAPQLNRRTWRPECADRDLYFLCPRGLFVGPAGPAIMDSEGHLVWHREDLGNAYNLQVQELFGRRVLTFWAGDDGVVGHGAGFYYILDSSYRQMYRVGAIGRGLRGDLHEFKITAENTALLTVNEKRRVDDARFFGFDAQAWLWDCLFQEVSIASNTLLFEWRASQHFRYEESYHHPRLLDAQSGVGTELNAFDWFHINSVDKDARGNYLISARYTHAVSYISGRTGQVIWHLGGRNNSFQDLSDGHATDFAWQHDARWHEAGTVITIFDNAAWFGDDKRPARGIAVAVDTSAMTARLQQTWQHPDAIVAESQGSLQLLGNGHAFVGYGSAPLFSEFAADGTLLCDVAFGALHWRQDGEFGANAAMSYRVFKQPWQGWPVDVPRAAFANGHLFVSWNGATEVVRWRLESCGTGYGASGGASGVACASEAVSVLGEADWQGFESAISIPTQNYEAEAHHVYRLTALGREAAVLGVWSLTTDGVLLPLLLDDAAREERLRLLLGLYLAAGFALGILITSQRGRMCLQRVYSCCRGMLHAAQTKVLRLQRRSYSDMRHDDTEKQALVKASDEVCV